MPTSSGHDRPPEVPFPFNRWSLIVYFVVGETVKLNKTKKVFFLSFFQINFRFNVLMTDQLHHWNTLAKTTSTHGIRKKFVKKKILLLLLLAYFRASICRSERERVNLRKFLRSGSLHFTSTSFSFLHRTERTFERHNNNGVGDRERGWDTHEPDWQRNGKVGNTLSLSLSLSLSPSPPPPSFEYCLSVRMYVCLCVFQRRNLCFVCICFFSSSFCFFTSPSRDFSSHKDVEHMSLGFRWIKYIILL